jgi:hypothetical protein
MVPALNEHCRKYIAAITHRIELSTVKSFITFKIHPTVLIITAIGQFPFYVLNNLSESYWPKFLNDEYQTNHSFSNLELLWFSSNQSTGVF